MGLDNISGEEEIAFVFTKITVPAQFGIYDLGVNLATADHREGSLIDSLQTHNSLTNGQKEILPPRQ